MSDSLTIFTPGNAGFETADRIVSHTAYIHMAARSAEMAEMACYIIG